MFGELKMILEKFFLSFERKSCFSRNWWCQKIWIMRFCISEYLTDNFESDKTECVRSPYCQKLWLVSKIIIFILVAKGLQFLWNLPHFPPSVLKIRFVLWRKDRRLTYRSKLDRCSVFLLLSSFFFVRFVWFQNKWKLKLKCSFLEKIVLEKGVILQKWTEAELMKISCVVFFHVKVKIKVEKLLELFTYTKGKVKRKLSPYTIKYLRRTPRALYS